MSEKRSIQIVTLGCSKNEVDSEHLLAPIRDEYDRAGRGGTGCGLSAFEYVRLYR